MKAVLSPLRSLLLHLQPAPKFTTTVLIEPLLSPNGQGPMNGFRENLIRGVCERRDVWSTRQEARRTLQAKAQSWDSRVFDIYLVSLTLETCKAWVIAYPYNTEARAAPLFCIQVLRVARRVRKCDTLLLTRAGSGTHTFWSTRTVDSYNMPLDHVYGYGLCHKANSLSRHQLRAHTHTCHLWRNQRRHVRPLQASLAAMLIILISVFLYVQSTFSSGRARTIILAAGICFRHQDTWRGPFSTAASSQRPGLFPCRHSGWTL